MKKKNYKLAKPFLSRFSKTFSRIRRSAFSLKKKKQKLRSLMQFELQDSKPISRRQSWPKRSILLKV
jgi:hypothetical protein